MAESKRKFSTMVKMEEKEEIKYNIDFLMKKDEKIEMVFKSVRDLMFVTNKKIVLLDVKGLTGSKIEYICVPYSKIKAFSLEKTGKMSLNVEFKMWVSVIGEIEVNFTKNNKIEEISGFINRNMEY